MKVLTRALAMAAAVTALALSVQAQDEDEFADAETASADESAAADGEKPADEAAKKPQGAQSVFTALPFCRLLEGSAQVRKPGAADWEAVEEGRFYQLGSSFRTLDGSTFVLQFGPEVTVGMSGRPGAFLTRIEPIGSKSRAITLSGGVIDVKAPTGFAEGLFSVVSPGFKVVNVAGHSRYAYVQNGDGDAAKIRCVTGSLRIEGRHYVLPALKAAEEIKIRNTADQLFTGIYGLRGKCSIELDQGLIREHDFQTGEDKIVTKPLVWKLTPRTSVKINRAMPALGERMSVSVMTFDAKGFLHDRCAFVEGRAELGTREYGVGSKGNGAAKAESEAASAATTVEVDVDAEEEGGEGGETPSSDDSSSSDSSSDSSSSSSDDDDFGF